MKNKISILKFHISRSVILSEGKGTAIEAAIVETVNNYVGDSYFKEAINVNYNFWEDNNIGGLSGIIECNISDIHLDELKEVEERLEIGL